MKIRFIQKLGVCLALVWSFMPSVAVWALEEEWVARYGGGESDYAYALAVDAYGNVYVTGESLGSGTDFDFATIKYNASGNQLWVARYDGSYCYDEYCWRYYDSAHALAVDADGNVYVTGESWGDDSVLTYAIIKYDASGNLLWTRDYEGPGLDTDAYGLAVDADGNVYVTGYDFATIKYDASGKELWVVRYEGPRINFGVAYALAVDADGNVYVTGESNGDFATVKYDASGKELWGGPPPRRRRYSPGTRQHWQYICYRI